MEDKKIIRCFIASPGDTAEERELCGKNPEINVGIGTAYGLSINLFDGKIMSIRD